MAVLSGGIAVDLSRRIRPLFSFPNPSLPSIQRRSPATFRSPLSCRIPCFRSSGKLERNAGVVDEEDVVTKFDPEGFAVLDRVSVGLAGRADEAIFEAIVTDPDSPLYDMKVVLRQLKTVQAQRRGKRALQVLKRLARRRLLYHSYAMQVHGYVFLPSSGDLRSFTLVHGYHGSYSLKHWLQLSDWLPTLEATLELDEEWVRRIGDDTLGGPALTRQLRLTRILMRDLLIGVNYLHSHGLAHTELRLENVHICPVDRHVKVGILGNAADFCDGNVDNTKNYTDRRQLMIAYDMRCVGFMMAKMVLRELLDPEIFTIFKSFLSKGGSPSCLREFLLPFLCRNYPSGNRGLQMLDRNWGAGWNLLSMLLATKPSQRISCLNALRHPFLCGPRWRVDLSMDVIMWGLGSTAVRITEEYIYGLQQRSRLAYLIELMEMLNTNPKLEDWKECLPGRWRLLYSTGRQVGLTLREAKPRVLIDNLYLTFTDASETNGTAAFSISSDISFRVISTPQWPHKKSGITGSLRITSPSIALEAGSRAYLKEETHMKRLFRKNVTGKVRSRIWKHIQLKEPPFNLPTAKLTVSDIEIALSLDATFSDTSLAESILREVRIQIPPEAFDVSKIVCGTYVDSRLMVLRGVNGSALLLTRSVCL